MSVVKGIEVIIRGKKVVEEGLDIDSQVVSKNYKKHETEFPVLRFILESSELDGEYPRN